MAANQEHAPSEGIDPQLEREIELLVDQGVANYHEATAMVLGIEPYQYREDDSESHPVEPAKSASKHRKPRGTSYPQEDEPDFREPTYVERTPEERAELKDNIAVAKLVARTLQLRRLSITDPDDFARQRAINRARADERRYP